MAKPELFISARENDEGEKLQTILIAEDNEELRLLLKEAFENHYNLLQCQDGKEGWDSAIEQIPDLIISDVMMPEMDGFTLCHQLKTDERTSHIPVILLTAKSLQRDHVTGLETGADLYLTKPFSTKVVELSVRNLLASRDKLRQKLYNQLSSQLASPAVSGVPAENLLRSIDQEFLNRVIQLVEDNMDDPEFGVDFLSRKMAMSQPVLYKKLKAVTDMSVNDFVKSLRMKKASELLQQKTHTIYEVAYVVGYNDRKYFSKEFKKQFGKTPTEYSNEVK